MKPNSPQPARTIDTMKTEALEQKKTWKGEHAGFRFEIVHWGFDCENDTFTHGRGHWNYYVYVREEQTGRFAELWLDGEIKEWISGGRKYLSYDYYSIPVINDAGFHGGVTFYETGNERLPGQRYVKIGCDYGHLCDMERGFPATLQSVLCDAEYSCAMLAGELISPPVTQQQETSP